MELLNENNFELWISGSGNNSFLRSAIKNDKRIKFFGLLTSKQLQNAYKKADIFLNPRPVDMFVNDISFPSKLFDYLSWNKPIISTCTKSLDPIYKKILHIVEDNPASIALAMRSYLEGKKYYKIKNKKWILNKNWNNEANKLKNFLKKVIIKKNFT
jgi:glycosyltransferase involved in cell wall biosynthesis